MKTVNEARERDGDRVGCRSRSGGSVGRVTSRRVLLGHQEDQRDRDRARDDRQREERAVAIGIEE